MISWPLLTASKWTWPYWTFLGPSALPPPQTPPKTLQLWNKRPTPQLAQNASSRRGSSIDSRVPQGTVLSSLQFLCHINDLPESMTSQVHLFTDGCLIYGEINNLNNHLNLQEDLKKLEEWAQNWGMRFNARECHIISIANRSSFFYSLDNTILKQVSQTPYLDILFSDNLKWSHHISNIIKTANCMLGFLWRNLHHCPSSCQRNTYLALLCPVLEYGTVVWNKTYRQDGVYPVEWRPLHLWWLQIHHPQLCTEPPHQAMTPATSTKMTAIAPSLLQCGWGAEPGDSTRTLPDTA